MSWNPIHEARNWGLALIVVAAIAACGGDSDPMTPPPPPTVTIQSVVVSAPVDSVQSGETAQLSVTVTDSNNQAVTNPTVAWTSSDPSVVSVSATGLVSGQAEGAATVTATVSGVAGNVGISVYLGSFEPLNNMTLSGTVAFTEVVVPAGVTVTVTDDLALSAINSLTIDGEIVGDCVGIQLAAGEDVSITGGVSSVCTSGTPTTADDGAIEIYAGGVWSFDDADIVSATNLVVSNRASDFPSTVSWARQANAASGALVTRAGDCIERNSRFTGGFTTTDPRTLEEVRLGLDVFMYCEGEFFVEGGELTAGSGRDGTPALMGTTAIGEDGEDSGQVRLFGTSVNIQVAPLIINGGNGGHGGDAQATGLPGIPDAVAHAGNGGHAYLPLIKATSPNGGVFVGAASQLRVVAGRPGNGGSAYASGLSGGPALGAIPAQDGGLADARGGHGGHAAVADEQGDLTTDMFVGSNVTVIGAALVNPPSNGNGGAAEAIGGAGGAGGRQAPTGGAGGETGATGGDGGDYTVDLPGGQPIRRAGLGGGVTLAGGHGGPGFDDCQVNDLTAGGNGGKGGDVIGLPGQDGLMGPFAKTELDNVGVGGRGGQGITAGAGGAAGADNISSAPQDWVILAGPNLTGGPGGSLCETSAMTTDVTVKDDPSGHEFFALYTTIKLLDLLITGQTALALAGSGPWVNLTGAFEANLSFILNGNGTVAGFPNIAVVMVGLLIVNAQNRVIGVTGEVTVGANGGLPTGAPAVYDVTSSAPAGSAGWDPALFGLTSEQIEAGVTAGTIIRRSGAISR